MAHLSRTNRNGAGDPDSRPGERRPAGLRGWVRDGLGREGGGERSTQQKQQCRARRGAGWTEECNAVWAAGNMASSKTGPRIPIHNQQPPMWHPPHLRNSIQTQQKSRLLESYIATFQGNSTTPLNRERWLCRFDTLTHWPSLLR